MEATKAAGAPQAAKAARAAKLVPFAELARLYAAGALTSLAQERWAGFDVLADEALAQGNEALAQVVGRIAHPRAQDAEEFPYEFNRLFVGPAKLAAPPYETVYVSDKRTLMQHSTLSVRKRYRAVGFEPEALNVQPDDHLAFELGFMVRLLERGDEESLSALADFLENHLGRWHKAHTNEVRANTENDICLAFADLIDEVVLLGRMW